MYLSNIQGIGGLEGSKTEKVGENVKFYEKIYVLEKVTFWSIKGQYYTFSISIGLKTNSEA